MDNISIGVTPQIDNVVLNAGVNNQIIDITLIETAEVVNLDITPNLIEINIIRSEGEVQILQFASYSNFPATGKANYFYLAKDTNKLYRWTGSTYAEIGALGYTAENVANKGIANGYAGLDSTGKVPSTQLPSYVDDVIEVANYAALPATGETGKIYITLDTNNIYRWSGSVYVEISTDKAVWGGITGTLANQSDLVSALAAKQNNLNGTGYVKSNAGVISYVNETYLTTADAGNTYVPYTGAIADVNLGSNDITAASFVKSGGTSSQFLKADGSIDSTAYAADSNVVHKTGDESIAGIKTFTDFAKLEQNLFIKHDNTTSYLPGYNIIDADASSMIFGLPVGYAARLVLSSLTQARNFTLPDASGTLALTTDIPSLSGYVPTSRTITIDGTTQDLSANRTFTINYPITSFNTRTGAITLSSTDVTTALGFTPYNATNPSNYIDASALTPYLLLAGGTMTGALNGTSASYSGNVTALSFIKTGGTSSQFLKADGTIDSSSYALSSLTISTNGPLSGGGDLTANRTLSISKADTSTDGYLSSTDWDTFNDKQAALSGTGFVKISGSTISYDNSSYYLASNPNGYTSNAGTVTSVAVTVPSAFSVSGSPITSSGTLAITATGNTTQYIAGDGSLVTFPSMSNASTLVRSVRNATGATLTKGTVVYISGATGNKPTVSKAIATGDSTSAQTFGIVQADIANNADGNVVCVGDLTGLDTSTFTEGDQLYLSSTTAGAYTTTKQYAPAHLVYIGIVTRAHPTLGQIEVNIQNGYELDELHNVAAQTPSNNDGLFYETSTSLWKNKSISTVIGYTPEQPITFSSPLSRSTNTVSMPAATGSVNGYLTSTDWTTFNNKLSSATAASTYLPLTGGTLTGGLAINLSGGTGLNVASDSVVFRSNTGIGSPRQLSLSMGGGTLVQLQAKGYGASYITDLGIQTFNSSGTAFNVFYGTSAGLVGIGTTTPQSLLHLESSSSNGTSARFTSTSTNGRTYAIGSNFVSGNGEFSIYDYTAGAERMRITSGGTAQFKGGNLDDLNTTALRVDNRKFLTFYNAADTGWAFGLVADSSNNGALISNNNMIFATGSSATERMRITSDGNVLIGATSAISTRQELRIGGNSAGSRISLGVSGTNTGAVVVDSGRNIYMSNEYNDSAIKLVMINFNNGVYLSQSATSWTSNSDERLKTDLVPIENATDKVNQLRSVIGRYKTDDISKRRPFLIAQDVLEVLPEATNLDDSNGMYGVQYTEIIPLLVASIKELKAELDTLKNN